MFKLHAIIASFSVFVTIACSGDDATHTEPVTPSVARVEVTAPTAIAAIAETVQLTAVAVDGQGNVIPGKTFTWISSDTSVGVVSSTGLLTARAEGSVTVTAVTEGREGHATIEVLALVLGTVQFEEGITSESRNHVHTLASFYSAVPADTVQPLLRLSMEQPTLTFALNKDGQPLYATLTKSKQAVLLGPNATARMLMAGLLTTPESGGENHRIGSFRIHGRMISLQPLRRPRMRASRSRRHPRFFHSYATWLLHPKPLLSRDSMRTSHSQGSLERR